MKCEPVILLPAGVYAGECPTGDKLVLCRNELLWVLDTRLDDMEAADAGDGDSLTEVVEPLSLSKPGTTIVCTNLLFCVKFLTLNV